MDSRLAVMLLVFSSAALCRAGGEVGYADGRSACDRFVLTRDNSSVAPYRTSVTFAPADDALTVLFSAEAPGVGALAASTAGKGAWACAENFELFLDVSGTGKSLLHLAVSANGGWWDERTPKAAPKELDWKASANASKDSYTAKAVFPWASLGLKGRPATGARWRINVGRNFLDASGATVFSSFAATGVRYKEPARFADLYFGSPEDVVRVRQEAVRKDLEEIRAEIGALGVSAEFKERLAALERTGKQELVAELRDELVVVRAMKGGK